MIETHSNPLIVNGQPCHSENFRKKFLDQLCTQPCNQIMIPTKDPSAVAIAWISGANELVNTINPPC